MAKKLKTDDFNFDDDLDMPDFNFGGEEVPDDRKTITKLKDAVKDSAKATLMGPSTYTRVLRGALPKEYGEAFDLADTTVGSVKDSLKDAVKEMKPAIGQFVDSADKFIPDSSTRMKKLMAKVKGWVQDDYRSSGMDARKQQEANIQLQLGAIFKEQAEATDAAKAEGRLQSSINLINHKDQMGALNSIASDTSRLQQYNTKVNQAWQRKTLEIQLRSYGVQADSLTEMRKANEISRLRLDAIVKNTALPDYLKMKTTEAFGESMRNKFINKSQDYAAGMFGKNDLLNKTLKNLDDKIKSFSSDVASAISMLSMPLDMMNMEDEFNMSGRKKTLAERGVGWVAGSVMKKKIDKATDELKDYVEKSEKMGKVREGAYHLGKMLNADYRQSKILEAVNSAEEEADLIEEQGAKGMVKRLAVQLRNLGRIIGSEIVPNMKSDMEMQVDKLNTARSPAVYSNHAQKAITEIIPGYLSRILREVIVTRTGDSSTDLLEYDMSRNMFRTATAKAKDIKNTIVQDKDRERIRSQAVRSVKDLDDENELTEEQQLAMAQFLARRNLTGGGTVDLNNLTNESIYRGSPVEKDAEKYIAFFKKKFDADDNNKIRSDSGRNKHAEFTENYHSIGKNTTDVRGYVQSQINAGEYDALRNSGYMKADGSGLDPDAIVNALTKDITKTATSDIYQKQNINGVNPKMAVDAIKQIGTSSWSYKGSSASYNGGKTQIGPMAQRVKSVMGDSYAPGGKKIDLVNLNGLNMTGIIGLDQKITDMQHTFSKLIGKDALKAPGSEAGAPKTAIDFIKSNTDQMLMVMNDQLLFQTYQITDPRMVNANPATTPISKLIRKLTRGKRIWREVDTSAGGRVASMGRDAGALGMMAVDNAYHGLNAAYDYGDEKLGQAYSKAKQGHAWAKEKFQLGKKRFQEASEEFLGKYDLYMEGEVKPRLTAAAFKAGSYYDQTTGKVITKLTDVKGAIVDRVGNIVLTPEELMKSFYKTNITGKMTSAYKWLKDFTIPKLDAANEYLEGRVKVLGTIRDKVWETIKDLADYPRDLYLKGEDKPRITGIIMRNGGYFSKKTGKVLRRPSDIDGDVVSSDGNNVVTLAEMQEAGGLHDNLGRAIQTPFLRVAGMLGRGAGTIKDKLQEMGTKIKDFLKTTKDKAVFKAGEWMDKSNFDLGFGMGGKAAVDLLTQIRDILDERLAGKPKSILGDGDGDGIRENSYKDKQKELKEEGSDGNKNNDPLAERENSNKPVKYDTKNTFDMIFGGIGKFMGGLGSLFGGEGSGNGRSRIGNLMRRGSVMARRRGRLAKGGVLGKLAGLGGILGTGAEVAGAVGGLPGTGGIVPGSAGAVAGGASTADKVMDGVGAAADVADVAGAVRGAGTATTVAGDAAAATGAKASRSFRAGRAIGKVGGFAGRGVLGAGKLAAKGAWGAGKLATKGVVGAGKLGMRALPGIGTAYGLYSGVNNLMDGNFGAAAFDLGIAAVSAFGVGSTLSAVGAAGAGILAALASPVVLGGIAIGAAGFGAYKAYKYFTRKEFKDIDRLRFIQYGLQNGDDDKFRTIYEFEQTLTKSVNVEPGGKASIQEKGIDLQKFFDIFGIDKGDQETVERAQVWLTERFKPVFLTHSAALFSIKGDKDLTSIEKLTRDEKLKMLPLVRMSGGPWNVTSSPFPAIKQLRAGTALVEAAFDWVKKKIEEIKDTKSRAATAASIAAGTMEARIAAGDDGTGPVGVGGKAFKVSTKPADIAKAAAAATAAGHNVAGGNTPLVSIMSAESQSIRVDSLTALKAVRFKTYGLADSTYNKVLALNYLEEGTLKEMRALPNEKVLWVGDVAAQIQKAAQFFEFHTTDAERVNRFTQWFLGRFLPTYTAYLADIYTRTKKTVKATAEMMLTAQQSLEVANMLAGLRSVWRVTDSPWKDVELLTDSEICEPNLEYLRSKIKDLKIAEEKASKTETGGMSTGSTSDKKNTSGAPAKKETWAEQVKRMQDADPLYKQQAAQAAESAKAAAADMTSYAGKGGTGNLKPGDFITKDNAASKGLSDGANFAQYVRYADYQGGKASIEGLRPQMKALLCGMIQEYGELTGKTAQINRGFVTYAQQAAQKKATPSKAAAPGTSMHEFGLAVDMNSATLNEMDKMGLLKKYGFTRPVGGEPWHLEPAGVQFNRAGAKKDPAMADQMLAGSPGKGGGGFGTVANATLGKTNSEMAKELYNSGTAPSGGTGDATQMAEAKKPETGGEPTPATAKADGVASVGSLGNGKGYADVSAPEHGAKGYKAMEKTIADASAVTGVDKNKLAALIGVESTFNPNAGNKRGSATGLGQFTKDTWDEMVKKYGKQYGIDANTSPTDPRANAIMTGLYYKQNEASMLKYKDKVTEADIYSGHMLGPTGSYNLHKMNGTDYPATSMRKAAKDNPEIFYHNGDPSRPRTKDEIMALYESKIANVKSTHGIGSTTATATAVATAATDTPKMVKTGYSTDAPAISEASKITTVQSPVQKPALAFAPRPSQGESVPQTDPQRAKLLASVDSISTVLEQSLTVQQEIRDNLRMLIDNKGAEQAGPPAPTQGSKSTEPKSYVPDRSQRPVTKSAVSMQHKGILTA